MPRKERKKEMLKMEMATSQKMEEMESLRLGMISWYHQESFTSNYCFGFSYHGVVYAALVDNASLALLQALTKLEKASSKNGGGYALKYKMNAGLWELVKANAKIVKAVCSVDYLEELNRNSKKNRGYLFEELAANLFGGILDKKLNTTFRDGGDFYINGKPYQAKYVKATFTNEATMHRMMGR